MKYTRIDIRRKRVLDRILSFLIQYPKDKYELRSHLIDELKEVIEDTEKGYPELFVRYCIEYVDIDDRDDLGYKYSILNDNGGDYKTFPDMDKVFEYWLNEINNK